MTEFVPTLVMEGDCETCYGEDTLIDPIDDICPQCGIYTKGGCVLPCDQCGRRGCHRCVPATGTPHQVACAGECFEAMEVVKALS